MNRINVLFALCAAAVLSTLACNSPSAPGSKAAPSGSAALTTGNVLRIDSYPCVLAGDTFTVDVSVRNASGQLVNVTDTVTLQLGNNPTAATLSGGGAKSFVNGVASFTNLSVNKVGQGYTLNATTVSNGSLGSAPFNVDYSESNDGADTAISVARPISPKVPVFGSLGPGEVHYFRFAAKTGQLVAFSSYSNRVDMKNWDTSLRLRLLAPDGTTELARSGAAGPDLPGVDTGMMLLRIPADGVYFLVANVDQRGFLSGQYALLMRFVTSTGKLQTETEPPGVTGQNDTIATAQKIVPGLVVGQFDTPASNLTASDFYKLSVGVDSRIVAELIAGRNGAAFGDVPWDGKLELQDAAGNVLWSNDNTWGSDPAIDYRVSAPGTYYIRVTRSNNQANTASSPYFLSVDSIPYQPENETAGNVSTLKATPFGYASEVRGSFAGPGDHYFAFGGTAGDVVRLFVVDRTQSQFSSLLLSPLGSGDVAFLAQDGVTELPAGSSFSTPSESRLNVRQTILRSSGTYFIRVRSNAAGTFGLRLEQYAFSLFEAEPNNTFADADPLSPQLWASGVISAPGDVDHFKVSAQKNQLITVSILAAAGGGAGTALSDFGSSLMPNLEVRDSSGALLSVASADRKGESNYAESLMSGHADAMVEVSFRAPANGNYDIAVSDADGQGGPTYFYALRVGKNL